VNLEVSRHILELLENAYLLEFVVDRPAHDRRYRVDPSRLLALGWTPQWSFSDGLAATVEWYVANESWWRPIKKGEHHQAYYAQNYADRSVFNR
jgi:dTDP-glucose 4,6-dehydratase